MTPNQRIALRRREMNLSHDDVAERTGMSFNEYWDLEQHADEAEEVVDLAQLKAVCGVLGLDLLTLFDVACSFCDKRGFKEEYLLQRSDLIRIRRVDLGLSVHELADYVGFEDAAIVDMEANSAFLETWSINLIRKLADRLGIPLQVLLGVKCGRCGR